MGLPKKQNKRYTYADYSEWPDDTRYELIDGVVYSMTPAPSEPHQSVSIALLTQLCRYFEKSKCKLYHAPFDVLLAKEDASDDEIYDVVQPDILVICDTKKISKRGCTGAPDFVIEISSPSTATKDQFEKAILYDKHGVKEYWIVHPSDRIVFIRRKGADGAFEATEMIAAKGKVSVPLFPDLVIDFDKIFPEDSDIDECVQ